MNVNEIKLRNAIRKLILESIEGNDVVSERPWSVQYTFSLSKGTATDSEGAGPDGFAVVMSSQDVVMKIMVDSYWNPQSGDQSGNSLKVEINDELIDTKYVPVKFDDGKDQKLLISNSPQTGIISVSHAGSDGDVPVVYAIVENPFPNQNDIEFNVENLGNGKIDVKITGFTNL